MLKDGKDDCEDEEMRSTSKTRLGARGNSKNLFLDLGTLDEDANNFVLEVSPSNVKESKYFRDLRAPTNQGKIDFFLDI